MNRRLAVVLTVTLSASGAYTLHVAGASQLNTPPRDRTTMHTVRGLAAEAPVPGPSAWSSRPTPPIDGPADPPVQDLYGNDISDAVERYKFDAEGTAYEEHSPQTEIPRLRPPTT